MSFIIRTFRLLLVSQLLFLLTAGSLFAQGSALEADSFVPVNPEFECSAFFSYDSVVIEFGTVTPQVQPGERLSFEGTLRNDNTFPLLDTTLYARVFRVDDTTASAGDGNPVVDQFVVEEGFALAPGETKGLVHEWLVPRNAIAGEYYIGYYLTAQGGDILSGLTYTDHQPASVADFSVLGETTEVAELSKLDTTINGEDYVFTDPAPVFDQSDNVIIRTTITNPTDEAKTIPLQWTQYSWDGIEPTHQRHSNTELIMLEPGETREVDYVVLRQPEPTIYVTAVTQDLQAKSYLNLRLVQQNADGMRLQLPGLSAFPLQAGEETTLFTCAETTNVPAVDDVELSLTLVDGAGNTIHDYTYNGTLTGALSGFADSFVPEQSYSSLTLLATLRYQGDSIDQTTLTYDCNNLFFDSCAAAADTTENEKEGMAVSQSQLIMMVVGAVVLLLILLVMFVLLRKKIASKMLLLLCFTLVGGSYLSTPTTVDAASGSASAVSSINYHGPSGPTDRNHSIVSRVNGPEFVNPGETFTVSGRAGCNGLDYSSSVTAGTGLGPHTFPGEVVVNCQPGEERSVGTVSITASMTPGSYSLNVQARRISSLPFGFRQDWQNTGTYTYTVVAANTPPNAPTISGPTTGVTGTLYPFTFIATDPGDRIRYEIDWNNDGFYEQLLPGGFSYVNSGVSQGWSRSWSTAGTYTIRARTRDDADLPSSTFDTHTITISNPSPPPNNLPGLPTITESGGNTGLSGDTQWFTFTASDPDSDNIRFQVDTNNDGNPEAITTWTGSGGTRSWSNNWGSAGTYSFRVRTQDDNLAVSSSWRSYSITISDPPVGTYYLIATSPTTITEGGSVNFEFRCHYYAGLTPVTRAEIDGGNPDPLVLPGPGGSVRTFTQTFTSAGNYLIRGTCAGDLPFYEDDMLSGSVAVTVNPAPSGPVYLTATSPTTITEGDSVNFEYRCWPSIATVPVDAVEISGGNPASQSYSTTGGTVDTFTQTFSSAGTYTITANCLAGGGVESTLIPDLVPVTVNPALPPSCGIADMDYAGWDMSFGGPGYLNSGEPFPVSYGTTPAPSCCSGVGWYNEPSTCASCYHSDTPVFCGPPPGSPAVTADLTIDGNSGSYSVPAGTLIDIEWDSTNADTCTAFGPDADWVSLGGGSGKGIITIPATYSGNYQIYCSDSGSGLNDSGVVNLTVSNTAPNAPTINHTGGGRIAGVPQTFEFRATDPNGDDIYYHVDWNNDGTINSNERAPAVGLVPNDIPSSRSNTWSTPGSYTFQARTFDAGGTPSAGWTSHTIDIDPAPSGSISVTGCTIPGGANNCNGQASWTISAASSPNVRNDTTGTTVSTANIGTNVAVLLQHGVNTIQARDGSNILDSDTANVTCASGATWDGVLCVEPNLSGSIFSDTPSAGPAGFDPATGNFNTVTVRVGLQNSGAPVTGTFDVIVDVDRDDGAGWSDPYTYSFTNITPTWTDIRDVPFNNIPFGGVATVRVRIDPIGAITESDTLDNTFTAPIATGVPPIDMDLTLVPSQLVRSGGSVNITYDTNATFSMSCELSGPGLTTHSFNPNSDGPSGTVTAVGIVNKSQYTLSCTEQVSGTNQVFIETASIETTGYIEEL